MTKFKLKDYNPDNDNFPYIIAEIGANHNGDMELAKEMIRSAVACGADAVKFQSWSPNSIVSTEEYQRNTKYNDNPKKHFGSLREMVEKYYLRPEQHYELKEFCDYLNIDFSSTAFTTGEVDLLEDLDVKFHKIASMDLNNINFISYVASKMKPILLSTGMGTLAEIENAIRAIEDQKNRNIILLHCISIYPPRYDDINLNNIKMLQQAFGYPVGFSDHSIGTSIPIAAVALGAKVIEKHFTIDKSLPGWDHEVSANPTELDYIRSESDNVVKSLGSYRRVVSSEEEEKKKKFRRSIVVNKNLPKGHILTINDLNGKRPGTGITLEYINLIIGRKLNKNIANDTLLNWEDLI